MKAPQFFTTFGAKRSEDLSWTKLLDMVTSTSNLVYRNTLASRKARAEGNEPLASRLKSSCGLITPCCHCQGERKTENMALLTMVGMVDIDHIPAEAMAEAMARVKADAHTLFCHVTNSQLGIRVLFAYDVVDADGAVVDEPQFAFGTVADEDHAQYVRRVTPVYRAAWEAGTRYYATLTGFPTDKSCKDPVRISFLCHDPEAQYNPEAQPLVVTMAEVRPFADNPRKPSPTDAVHAAPVLKDQVLRQRVQQLCQPTEADESLIRGLLEVMKYRPSNRHRFWLRLGQKLRACGHTLDQIPAYKEAALRILSDRNLILPDDPSLRLPHEIEDAMRWGMERTLPPPSLKGGSQDAEEDVENPTQDTNWPPPSEGGRGESPGGQGEGPSLDDIITSECPTFPEAVYLNLPEQLYKGLGPLMEAVERGEVPRRRLDVLLMGLLANYSALCPETQIPYGNNVYTPNLGFMNISIAGNGKSVLTYAYRVVEKVDAYLEETSRKEHSEWQQQQDAYQLAMQDKKLSREEKQALERPGDEPQDRLLVMPGTTSRSQFTLCMHAMGRDGLIINSTEIQTITATLKQDVGDFSDLLCKAMANERIDQYFKCDNHRIKVERPKLSVCLSGTFNQFHQFIPDFENGLFSRFAYLMMEPHLQWISQQPDPNYQDYTAEYQALADDAFQMWQLLQQCPTIVLFTDEQWQQHGQHWAQQLDGLVFEGGEDRISIVNRHGLLHMRLAAVLTVLRKWNEYRRVASQAKPTDDRQRQRVAELFAKEHPTMTCRDDDFQTALLMADVMLRHALHLSTTIVQLAPRNVQPMTRWPWTVRCVSEMDEVFRSEDFCKRATQVYGRVKSQAYRSLKKLVTDGFVTKHGRGTYRKQQSMLQLEKSLPPTSEACD